MQIPYRLALPVIAAAVLGAVVAQASASELVYRPVNPAFGGDPFNSAYLLGTAQAQDDYDDPDQRDAGLGGLGTSPADLFVRQLESRLLSALAGQVTEALFGENPQESGTIVFGSQTITFVRGLEAIHLTIFDSATNQTTEISVPTLIVN